MSAIGIILLVVFVIICVLVVALVLLQNEESGMGGLLGGSGTQAFGSRSANVLTKTTYVLVTLFFLTSFGLAILNKTPVSRNIDTSDLQGGEASGEWWNETAAEAELPAAE